MRPNRRLPFVKDSRGVAPVVGFILIWGILMLALAGYQAEIVPQQNSEVEFQHYQSVTNDLMELRNAILTSGQVDVSQFQTVELGTDYQPRTITINPPPAVGTIQTSSKSYDINIEDEDGTEETIPTRFIEYRPGYSELEANPVWYENSVVYIDGGDRGGVAIIEEQGLIKDETLRLTALQGNISESGTQRETFELYHADPNSDDLNLNGNLKIEIPTRLTGTEYWDEALADHEDKYDGVDDDAYELGVHKLQLKNINTDDDKFELNTVGVSSEPDKEPARYNVQSPESRVDATEENDLPSGKVAYDDENDNGEYDNDEETFSQGQFSDDIISESNLVIVKDIDTDDAIGRSDLQGLTIREGVQFRSSEDIDLGVEDGSINARGAEIRSEKYIDLTVPKGSGDVDLRDAVIASDKEVTVEGDNDNSNNLLINEDAGDGGTRVVDLNDDGITGDVSNINVDGDAQQGGFE